MNIKLLFLVIIAVTVQPAVGQPATHLRLSNDYPSAGEKISFTYDTSGTVIGGKKDIQAFVFFLDNKDFPVADVDLKASAKLLGGEFTIPTNAEAFFVKITAGDKVDNNNGKGYVYLVYKDNQPTAGAYAMKGYFLASLGKSYAKITPELKEAAGLYQKEFELHPAGKKDYQKAYYYLIATRPEYKDDVSRGISMLEKSNEESDLMLAVYLLSLRNSGSADSLKAIIKTKFPGGLTVKNEMTDAFDKAGTVEKKDSVFNILAKKYPEAAGDKSTSLDRFRLELAMGYLEKDNREKYGMYKSQLNDKTNLADWQSEMAQGWFKGNTRLDDAEEMAKESLDIYAALVNNTVSAPYMSPSDVKRRNRSLYNGSADLYASILASKGRFAEALKYEQPVIERIRYIDGDVYENYIRILTGLGDYAKAKEYAEKAMNGGVNTAIIVNSLETAFVKLNGSDKGLEPYIASLKAVAYRKQLLDLATTMINQPAPDFMLKDADGKTVSLSGLKGKVVILDFWATWCGYCKLSFPGMQIAVDKFKNDPGVKFLFLDTREKSDSYFSDAKKYIDENKYTFHVIFDEKDVDGQQRKIANAYNVSGIPVKLIIDKTGKIRFKVVGYYEVKPEELADEVSQMITIAGNPEAYSSAAAK